VSFWQRHCTSEEHCINANASGIFWKNRIKNSPHLSIYKKKKQGFGLLLVLSGFLSPLKVFILSEDFRPFVASFTM